MIDKFKSMFLKYKSGILYLFFGGLSTLLNIVVFFCLNTLVKMNYQVANVIAWIVVVIFAYTTNKIWVFESKTSSKSELIKETLSFIIARLITLGMEFVLLYVLIEKLHILEIISKIIINVVVIIVNYLFSKIFIFNSQKKNKEKMNFKKLIKPIILIFTIIAIIGLMLNKYEDSHNGYSATYYDYKIENASDTLYAIGWQKIPTEKIKTISQEFSINKKNAKYMYIHFMTQDVHTIQGKYNLKIINSQDKTLIEKTISNKYINDAKYKLDINELELGDYTLVLTSIDAYDEFYPTYNSNIKSSFYLNSKKINGGLDITILYKENTRYDMLYIMISIITLILVLLLSICQKDNIKLEKKFLILAIPIYIIYILLIPINGGHDEYSHWSRIFEITEGALVSEISDDNLSGHIMPEAVDLNIPWINNFKYRYMSDYKPKMLDYSEKKFISDGTAQVYSPVQYLPQVIGVSIAKGMTNNTLIIYYIGRIINFIFCISILYLAIKTIPYAKRIFFILAFIPIAIEGFTTLSADGMLISVCYYFIAYILSIIENREKINIKDYIIITILGIFIALSKIVYIPIIGLLILIPESKFKSKKDKIVKISIIIPILLLINIIWLKIAGSYLDVFTEGKSLDQIAFILSNPFRYIQTILYSVEQNGINWVLQLFGRDMIHNEVIVNNIIPIILMIITIITVFNDNYNEDKKITNIITILAIIITIISLILTSIYIQWTYYGSEMIHGVQGRYFLPILPLILFIIKKFIKTRISINEKTLDKIIIYCCIITNYIAILELITKFI